MYISIHTVIKGCCRAQRTRQELAPALPRSREMPGLPCPSSTAHGQSRVMLLCRASHLSAEHTQGFLQVLHLQGLPLLKLSLQHLPGKAPVPKVAREQGQGWGSSPWPGDPFAQGAAFPQSSHAAPCSSPPFNSFLINLIKRHRAGWCLWRHPASCSAEPGASPLHPILPEPSGPARQGEAGGVGACLNLKIFYSNSK